MDWKNAKPSTTFERMRTTTGPHALRLIEFAGLIAEIEASGSENRNFKVLDNAGGMGIATGELFDAIPAAKAKDVEVICGDISPDTVAAASALFEERGWNAQARVIDGTAMALPDNDFTHVVTAMGIMNMAKPRTGLQEALRVLQADGIHAFSTVARAGWIDDVREAIASKLGSEGAPEFPQNGDFQMLNSNGDRWHEEEWALERTKEAGYVDVRSTTFQRMTRFASIDEYCRSMSGFIVKMLGVAWEKEDVEKFGPKFPDALFSYLTEKYGNATTTPYEFPLVTALIVGKKPEH